MCGVTLAEQLDRFESLRARRCQEASGRPLVQRLEGAGELVVAFAARGAQPERAQVVQCERGCGTRERPGQLGAERHRAERGLRRITGRGWLSRRGDSEEHEQEQRALAHVLPDEARSAGLPAI